MESIRHARVRITDSLGRGLRRLLHITAIDGVDLDDSVARCRVLVAIVAAGAKLLEIGELADRVEAIEAVMKTRRPKGKR